MSHNNFGLFVIAQVFNLGYEEYCFILSLVE